MLWCQLLLAVTFALPLQEHRREAQVGLYVLDITGIDDVGGSFTADVHLRVEWVDPRAPAGSVAPSELWTPDLVFLNHRSLSTHFPEVITVDEYGNCVYRQRFSGEWTLPLNLRDFPFDNQELQFTMISRTHDAGQLQLTVLPRATGIFEDLSIAGWEVGKEAVDLTPMSLPGQPRKLTRAHFSIPVERESFFYLLRIIGPLLLIVIMGWCIFWMDRNNIAGQLRMSASAFLTLTAFLLVIGGLLPKISYLTRMDIFVAGNSLIVFLAVCYSVLADRLAAGGADELSRRIRGVARWAYLLGVIVVTLLAFVF